MGLSADPPAEAKAESTTPQIMREALEAAITRHDHATRDSGVWLGAEPTFTDRFSEAPEWLSEALGSDKEARAQQLLRLLLADHPGALAMRPLGRQYPDEPEPRWCYGLYARRDGRKLWSGPVDRLRDGEPTPATCARLQPLRDALVAALEEQGWFVQPVSGRDEPTTRRLVCRPDGEQKPADPAVDARLARATIHQGRVEGGGCVDELAAERTYLVLIHAGSAKADENDAWLELPAFASVEDFEGFLQALERATRAQSLSALGLRGFAPPVDAHVAWLTLTPDPAVLEVNQAPEPDMHSFEQASRRLFERAAEVGLGPCRLHYNGEVADSGGGGQLTFGGPSPAGSPFFTTPELLPRLIRYVIRHPALSYWFATPYVGGSSQSPRPDEGVREALLELEVALEQLAQQESPTPELLWGTLRHFLADASGNPHRSALNIEKLYNPYLPGRGQLGLVELRALSMAPTLEQAAARALLLRSIVVMLQRADVTPRLTHWQEQLHDRFALPWHLREDLREVFADLEQAGLGLGETVEAWLLDHSSKQLAEVQWSGLCLGVEQALEFWPLVGDVASQEGGGSRLVDASTSRLQIRLTGQGPDLDAVQVFVNGCELPMVAQRDPDGEIRVMGVRYRSFCPFVGLHPAMPAEKHIEVQLRHANGGALRLTLHPWRPDGTAYPGLPSDEADAAARRAERAVVEILQAPPPLVTRPVPESALSPHCLDLRRVPGP